MKNHYIAATIELIQAGTAPQVVLEGLQKTMTQKGHMRLYGSVLRGIVRILETQKGTTGATVYVAKEAHLKTYEQEIKSMLNTVAATDDFATEIDETLIGGAVIKHKNIIVDGSYKTALTNLYRSTLN